jgi:hypothetical protein
MEKYIPDIVAAWLAGTYDRDRPVARAANEGITSLFDTDEKVLLLWRKCQSQILDYAQEAVKETPQTLSDERNTNADDMQAKYNRVMGSSISLVNNLLQRLADKDLEQHQESYESFLLGNKVLWSLITNDDAFLRRLCAQLLLTCLDKQGSILEQDLELISRSFVADGLKATQIGSAWQFLQSLSKLSIQFPEVWTSFYKGKKPARTLLARFIEKGSQMGPADFWVLLSSFLSKLPSGILPSDVSEQLEFLVAYRTGLASKDEPRANLLVAWHSYFQVIKYLADGLKDAGEPTKLVQDGVYPLFEQFLFPNATQSAWSVGQNVTIIAIGFMLCWSIEQGHNHASLAIEWNKLVDKLATNMATSLPEQSKDFIKSQSGVAAEGQRWFAIQAKIIELAEASNASTEDIISFLEGPSSSLVERALETLKSRNGKPYGAAGVLAAFLKTTPQLVRPSSSIEAAILSFFDSTFPTLLTSPSSDYLIASLYALCSLPHRESSLSAFWQAAVDNLLSTPESDARTRAIKALLSDDRAQAIAHQDQALQEFLSTLSQDLVEGQRSEWDLFGSAVTHAALNDDTATGVLLLVVSGLEGSPEQVQHSLQALEHLSRNPRYLSQGAEVNRLALMTRLLSLTESSDPSVVSRATAFKAAIEKHDTVTISDGQPGASSVRIIQENLDVASAQSLSVDTLIRQAKTYIGDGADEIAEEVLPNFERWQEALQQLTSATSNPLLAVMSAVGPTVWLIQARSDGETARLPTDTFGYSAPLRKALYASKLISNAEDIRQLPEDGRIELLWLIILTQLLASDDLGLETNNRLWSTLADAEAENAVRDFVAFDYIRLIIDADESAHLYFSSSEGAKGAVQQLMSRFTELSLETSPVALYAARAMGTLLATLVDIHGWKATSGEEWLAAQEFLKPAKPSVFPSVAALSGLQDVLSGSKSTQYLCNKLISEIAGLSATNEKTMPTLLLLNTVLAVFDQGTLPVAQNRLIFAIQKILSWSEDAENVSWALAAEASRALQFLLPSIKDVYGSYWETAFGFCLDLWNRPARGELDERLPAFVSTLRLLSTLQRLEEPNEDLQEALVERSKAISAGLLNLLCLRRRKENQPWRTFDELLYRKVIKIPLQQMPDDLEAYSLVASEHRYVQLAAFEILNRVISAAQEQISVDVLLEDREATLPEELLSLLLDAPISQNISDEMLLQFPPQIRTYLFSWQLVFAAYPKASHKVRSDYSQQLKSENYIAPLLNFLFDVLGHSGGQPLSLDKAGFTPDRIQKYDLKMGETETEERHMQWILVNLYYKCLKYAPNLAKSWWIDCKSKQTRMAVESWTERYFSPLVTCDILDEVDLWAAQQEAPADDEKELLVKVSKKSREVYAGCEVDEMQMQIVIRLPATFPLEGVKVDGVTRVVVSERKWQSWLMITQGVITFSVSATVISYE